MPGEPMPGEPDCPFEYAKPSNWGISTGEVHPVALDYPAVDVFEPLGRYRRHQRTTDDETIALRIAVIGGASVSPNHHPSIARR